MAETEIWTLENFPRGATSGVKKTFEEWGFGRLHITCKSLGMDEASFEYVSQLALTDTPPLAEKSMVVICLNDVRMFFGTVLSIPRRGIGRSESMEYKIGGPWWFLENKVYEQVWKTWWGVPGVNVAPTGVQGVDWMLDTSVSPHTWYLLTKTSHIVLNQRINNGVPAMGLLQYVKISTGQQIYDVLDWAISHGAPIAVGDEIPHVSDDAGNPILMEDVLLDPKGCPNADIPMDAVRDRSCAEIIKKQLLYAKNSCCWFDYTTTPYPTLHLKQRNGVAFDGFGWVDIEDGLTPVTIPLGEPSRIISELSVNPRYDMQVPQVKIKYEYQMRNDNGNWQLVVEDKAPAVDPAPEDGFSTLIFSVEMTGTQVDSTKAEVRVTPIALEDPNFWLIYHPELATLKEGFTITPGSGKRGDGSSLLPNVLNTDSSQIAPWMNVKTEQEVVSCKVAYKREDNSQDEQVINLNITATDAVSKIYQKDDYTSIAEPFPNGLASFLYNTLKHLQFDGSMVFTEKEISRAVKLGNVLNISGGDPLWATMNAMVTSISEDVDAGVTTVTFGTASYLSPSEFVELLRVNRLRKSGWAFYGRTGAPLNVSGTTLGDKSPVHNSSQVTTYSPVQVVTSNPETFTPLLLAKMIKLKGLGDPLPDVVPAKITHNSVLKMSEWVGETPEDGDITMQLGTEGSDLTTQGKSIAFRKYCVEVDGVDKSVILLGSEPF